MVQFHVLSLEGPDPYSRAGGIASRVTGLSEALAAAGFDTHLWFIGDPDLPAEELCGNLTLHRWCQWISRYHPGGVYDGEDGKQTDYAASLPPFLLRRMLLPHLSGPGNRAVVLAEEWQTVDAVLHLDWILRAAGLRHRVDIVWNANNTFGFERIDWLRLAVAARITTVSRYMRHRMWSLGIDPLVIPNGLPAETLRKPERTSLAKMRRLTGDRIVMAKVARWDPDKRWLLAVDTVADLKLRGRRPLLIARGGMEAHGSDVVRRATALGLQVSEREPRNRGIPGLMECLENTNGTDVLILKWQLCAEAKRALFHRSQAVLVNSGHEPFGLVGLEAMAAGGIACVGGTGEDYAIPGWNSLVLQTTDPREFFDMLHWLRSNPREERLIRSRAVATAKRYAWSSVVHRNLLPHLRLGAVDKGRPATVEERSEVPTRPREPRWGTPTVELTALPETDSRMLVSA